MQGCILAKPVNKVSIELALVSLNFATYHIFQASKFMFDVIILEGRQRDEA
jgi:hypothetical protein